jgi:hypothetical protein
MAIKFINPICKKGSLSTKSLHDGYISIGIKGKQRKSNRYEFCIKNMSRKNKLSHWKYVKVGFFDNSIIICEGTSNDGYLISGQNISIVNQHLVVSIINYYKLKVPTNPDDQCKLYFKADKLKSDIYVNYYKLTRI